FQRVTVGHPERGAPWATGTLGSRAPDRFTPSILILINSLLAVAGLFQRTFALCCSYFILCNKSYLK
ncbi:hypothetical protein LBW62_26000, partial [Ralstonia solanacearum]|uniref:hypothetical protein n=1 Tax=Ralstonia solanacearum TaxID=305 RepID=UPI001CF58AFD